MLPSGPPRQLRVLNDQAALACIIEAGAISRAELGRRTGLSKPGVAELLSRLERAGLVEKAGTLTAGGPGPAAQTWRVRSGVGFCAAADLTPSGWTMRVVDLDGTVAVTRDGGWEALAPDEVLAGAVRATFAAAALPVDRLLSVAVGVPGAVDPRTGVIRGAPHLPGLLGFDFAAAVRARLDVAVAVENDVNLMALAALHDGITGTARSFAFVWIDDGLGAAMVRDGALIRGFTGGAGEIDYVRIPTPSGAAGEKLGDLLSPAALGPLEPALSQSGSTEVADVVRTLALGLTSVVTVLDPEVIVLGGRYGSAIASGQAPALRRELAAVLETDLTFVPAVRAFAVDATTAINGAERVALDTARRIAFRSGSLTPTSPSPEHAAVLPGDHHERPHRHPRGEP